MPETAPAQVARLVHLVAWMSQRDTGKPVPYRSAAKHLRVSEKTLRQDLDTLVRLTDEYKPWLSSLNVGFTADGFMLTSQGPFRRPFRLTGDETWQEPRSCSSHCDHWHRSDAERARRGRPRPGPRSLGDTQKA